MKQRVLAFHIETAKLLPEELPDLLSHRPLGIAGAAVVDEEGQHETLWYAKQRCSLDRLLTFGWVGRRQRPQFRDRFEEVGVEHLGTIAPSEALDIGILVRPARLDIVHRHAVLGAPVHEGLSGELRAGVQGYVRDDRTGALTPAPHSLRAERSLAPRVRSASLWGRREVVLGEVLVAILGEVLAPRGMNGRAGLLEGIVAAARASLIRRPSCRRAPRSGWRRRSLRALPFTELTARGASTHAIQLAGGWKNLLMVSATPPAVVTRDGAVSRYLR